MPLLSGVGINSFNLHASALRHHMLSSIAFINIKRFFSSTLWAVLQHVGPLQLMYRVFNEAQIKFGSFFGILTIYGSCMVRRYGSICFQYSSLMTAQWFEDKLTVRSWFCFGHISSTVGSAWSLWSSWAYLLNNLGTLCLVHNCLKSYVSDLSSAFGLHLSASWWWQNL